MYLNVFSLCRRRGAASHQFVCIERLLSHSTWMVYKCLYRRRREEWGDMKTISYRAHSRLNTDWHTHTCTSAKIAKRSHATFDPAAPRIIELVLSLRPLGWRLTRSFHNLCLIYEGFGAACAAYIMFRIWGSSSDCIASRVENGDKTPSAAQWILFSNETLTPIWLWYLQMGHDESTRIGGVEQLFFSASLQFSFIINLFRWVERVVFELTLFATSKFGNGAN